MFVSMRYLDSLRRVARIWKKRGGGLFWKSETTESDLDPNFHWFQIRIKRFVINWGGFFAQNQVISKKKRSSPKLRQTFRPKPEIQTVFPPKNRWSKKKRSSPKLRRIFQPISNASSVQITATPSQLRHQILLGGGCFHFLSKNRPQKH